MREFIMECALVAETDEQIIKYLREIADKIEAGQTLDSMPGDSLQGYDWYVDDPEELEREPEEGEVEEVVEDEDWRLSVTICKNSKTSNKEEEK